MVILGLTGSIGMGKSTAAALFRRLGVPVHDADAEIHRLLRHDTGAIAAIGRAFPGVVVRGQVDRRKLGAQVFNRKPALQKLERILHPLARRGADRFLALHARQRARVVVLDIPLLFETSGARRVDHIVVVSAPAFLQRQRVLRRPGMSVARFEDVLALQMPDRLKRRGADTVVLTGLGKRPSLRDLRRVIHNARHARGRAWRPGYSQRVGTPHA
jgi:dephospho-CoA kinase